MIKNFTHVQKTNIEFGAGSIEKLEDILKGYNAKKILLVTDTVIESLPFMQEIKSIIQFGGSTYGIFNKVEPNPCVATVDSCADMIKNEKYDVVIGIGGGSVMDVAKGGAMLALNGGSIQDYLLCMGSKVKTPEAGTLPVVAVPTTAGTGSEVSNVIVVINHDNIKDLMLSDILLPKYAVIDPNLTKDLPAYITASTGLDVIGHALEGFTSVLDDAFAELLALEAIKLAFEYLPRCMKGKDMEARTAMAYACTLAGIAQTSCGCTVPHALSCPLTVHHKIPHGHAVGISQIPVINYTKDVIPGKYKAVIDYVEPCNNVPASKAGDYFIEKLKKLFDEVNISTTVEIEGLTEEHLNKLAVDAMADDGVNLSAKEVTADDLKILYRSILVAKA